MTPEREVEFEHYHARKQALKEQIGHLRGALAESAALYRALRLPLLSTDAGPILRECDKRQLLGSHLLVVGTNAIAAYMVEANGSIPLPDETRSEEHTSELQSLMRISYAVFCLKQKKKQTKLPNDNIQ